MIKGYTLFGLTKITKALSLPTNNALVADTAARGEPLGGIAAVGLERSQVLDLPHRPQVQ